MNIGVKPVAQLLVGVDVVLEVPEGVAELFDILAPKPGFVAGVYQPAQRLFGKWPDLAIFIGVRMVSPSLASISLSAV